jgi:A/G-specific adenine glycosylase
VIRRGALERALLAWFDARGRALDVRAARTPWEVLVIEVMSHQTQIERVGSYWRTFVERWPNPAALAAASTGEVLAAWAGLGYNRRALALREAARAIVADHGGEVPADVTALEALAGIGPYTARAVAATAFGRPLAPVDVNVRRVVGRLIGGSPDRATVQAEADRLVSRLDPRRWVSAVMDLAATVCTRRAPRCQACPVARSCASRGTAGDATLRRATKPFEHTNRWLRGRILARVREAGDRGWVSFAGPIGSHAPERVRSALAALAAEGFIEHDGDRARIA